MWYMVGAVACIITALKIKQKKPKQKNFYQAALIVTISFLFAAILFQMDQDARNEIKIERKEAGQGKEETDYLVNVEGILEEYPLKIQIEEKKLTEEQRKEYFEKAKKELDIVILGENTSKESVTKSLYLPETLQDGAVEVEYSFSNYEIFNLEGELRNIPNLPVLVEITAELTCQEDTCLYSFFVQVVPEEKTEKQLFVDKLLEKLSKENKKEGTDFFELPKELDGTSIVWEKQIENRSIVAIFLGIVGAAGILLKEKEEKKKKESKKQEQMLLDYPEIISQLSLLLGAGMNIALAWEKIAVTYQKKKEKQEIEKRYAYEEMLVVLYEIQSGVGELQAFENFGERCQLSVYRKLSSLIVQNVRKGAKGMQYLLEEEEREAFEQRKVRAKKAGEEAGTKLLLPMGIMLVIVLVILVVPAGLAISV